MARDLAEVVDFGRYEPLFRIGLGGMAEVYAARIRGEAGFQKLVAVKRMLPHLTGDPKFVDMFLDEARLAANISSPHVVQTLDLGRADDDSLYIVMNLVLGVTISEILRHLAAEKKFIETGIGVELIVQAAQGLDDAHEAVTPAGEPLSLVHRDISPQNILVGTDGRARVTDFGIAHAILLRRTETQVGELKGKFAYFSPEQALGKSLDRRSDIFALGIVAWELFTGRRLFKGTPLQQLEKVKRCEIQAPAVLRRDLPEPLSNAIMQALAANPDDRFASAASFASALRRVGGSFEDIPGPRAIGRFAKEVGGDRIERIRQCIANSGKLPSDVKTVTGIIEGTVSGTLFLDEPDDGTQILDESDEGTHILEGDASKVQSMATTRGIGAPATREEQLLAFGSQVTTEKIPEGDDGADDATAPTPPRILGEQPTFTLSSDANPTETSGPPDLEDHADLHQAPTEQWILSAETRGETKRHRAVLPIAAGALLLLLASGGALVFALFGDNEAGVEAGTEPSAFGAQHEQEALGSEEELGPRSTPTAEVEGAEGAEEAAGTAQETQEPTDQGTESSAEIAAEIAAEDEVTPADAPPQSAAMRRTMGRVRGMGGAMRRDTTMSTGATMDSPLPGWRP
ncbi:MAG: hypothetical protein DRJ42_03485 [Deltaproteobacteria bacterium]|nr:MAG: hypothetical protein DRJ42_03485 [Deltaproteobacteria bacterium]